MCHKFVLPPDFKLCTKRLKIELFTEKNVTKTYLEALNDWEVVRFTEARHNRWDEQLACSFIREANQNGSILLGVKAIENVKWIGNIRLFNFHKIHRRAELAFLFYDKDEWGKGYATEAISKILEFANESLKLKRICADYYACNTASAKVFKKLGFSQEGVFRDHFWLRDRFVDSIRVGKLFHGQN